TAVVDRNDRRGTDAGAVEVPPAGVGEVVVLGGQRLADHERVRQAVLDSGHGDGRTQPVEHAADVLVLPGVAVVGARVVADVAVRTGPPVAELLVRIVAARPDGTLRPEAAGVVRPRLVELVVVAGAAHRLVQQSAAGGNVEHPVARLRRPAGL